ncbi:pyridoxamine 5'-phosphate oxidase family protein [Psychromarinibacter sp. C21-152]|uniref:Pyridoxamine 5'-phosphate oxidase family protein n=1 Tax=Psychromarinibacter sediminicola TaxID=3033385 RepID=A0AAE3NS13_9RHOB|nr:pyridoxamine 5'-phosphate oxidase family protein [Psychromarinibacter sediminicola]MDF0601414.1 pyridoxamine 5'-phosphate oxidase family protein [Psychromarinibacter sediminicola]
MHWYAELDGLLTRLWDELDRATRDDSVAARQPTLATVGRDGPEARTVVLRDVSRGDGTVAVHTDNESTKCGEIAADPRVSLHVWEPRLQLQTRLRGRMTVATGAAVSGLWRAVPDGSRASYGVTPAPGTVLPRSDAYDRAADPARFAVLTMTVDEIDAVHLGDDYHRRALYARADGWRGAWLAP